MALVRMEASLTTGLSLACQRLSLLIHTVGTIRSLILGSSPGFCERTCERFHRVPARRALCPDGSQPLVSTLDAQVFPAPGAILRGDLSCIAEARADLRSAGTFSGRDSHRQRGRSAVSPPGVCRPGFPRAPRGPGCGEGEGAAGPVAPRANSPPARSWQGAPGEGERHTVCAAWLSALVLPWQRGRGGQDVAVSAERGCCRRQAARLGGKTRDRRPRFQPRA